MIKKANRKNLIISILVILILALGIGYAALSDTLTISGTANAKGTFDLEFQNAEVVKNVGADAEKTTVVISEDKNTLTVNAADLAYPGAGVEFSVDIVNVGTMPAEVQAVTPTNITGNDKIKVTGLEEIKVGHPKIEVGDRCNIHFTVEWPAGSGEIPEAESSINFGLQIEYTQSTGEVFEGTVSHTDTDKEGNTVTGGEIEEPTIREGILTEIIKPEDYGKSINYKATVRNNETNTSQEVSNWKLLYKDDNNAYIMLDDFLPNNLVPVSAGLKIAGKHGVYSNISREVLLNGLKTESHWNEFANGIEGSMAMGSPTLGIIIKSYNEKYETNLNTDSTVIAENLKLNYTDTLYAIPYNYENLRLLFG